MPAVVLVVEPYPLTGVVGIEVEELTSFIDAGSEGGWVSVLDTAVIGTFPAYTTDYQVTATSQSFKFRVRWETSAGQFTNWFSPLSVAYTPTAEQIERFTQAIIFKAVRFLKLPEAPFGFSGVTDWGMATVRPDYEIEELLYGLRFRDWDIDLSILVITDDVIRVGLQTDPADFPAASLPDVQRAIDSAISWVAHKVLGGVGIA